MNREYKRAVKKDEKRKGASPRPSPKPTGAPQKRQRTKPRQFVKEVVAELQKVNWPTRQEVASYSLVVLVSVIVIATIIFALDYIFTRAVLTLFGVDV